MINESLWHATAKTGTASNTRLALPHQTDVAIVGAGITGLTAAYLLKKAGQRVAVFERERIGSGETGNTSAHLTFNTDLRITDLSKRFGEHAARLVWEGSAHAIDLIESIVGELDIDCDFMRVPGFLCSSFTDDGDETDDMDADATLAQKLGFAVACVERGPITGKPALGFADQALFHPLKYLNALAEAVRGDGSFVFERCEVGQLLQDPLVVVVNGENIACGNVIIATHVPLAGSTGLASAMLFQTKLYPYSSYVVSGPVTTDISPGLYSDTSDPYNYLRIHHDATGAHAILGGQDHKTGTVSDTEERLKNVEALFSKLFPSSPIAFRWSGQVIETDDGLPFIGTTASNQYVATGYGGNGLTFGTVAAMMITDSILGGENPLAKLLDPSRKPHSLDAIQTLIAEGAAFPYYMIRDRLKRNNGASVDSIEPGDGKVLIVNGKRVACHRQDDGTLLKVSAVCTHLGCLVRWNNAERSWDCPCHGSRFAPDGLVLGGPAETPLAVVAD